MLAPNDLIFADSFETGDMSAWTSSATGGGDLTVTTAAALVGSYGLQAVINDTTSLYVVDESPSAETRYRARFYFDPNGLSMATNNSFVVLRALTAGGSPVLQLNFQYQGGYNLVAAALNDAGGSSLSSGITLTDTTHYVEVDWKASSGAGANNGYLTVWVNGTQQANLTGIDNDTLAVGAVRMGAVSGLDSGTSGTYYFDDFVSRRTNPIGGMRRPGSHVLARVPDPDVVEPESEPAADPPRAHRRKAAPGLRALRLLADPPAGQVWRSYYYGGGQRVAVRVQGDPVPGNSGLFFVLGDHLGSTSKVATSSGTLVSEVRYEAWGEARHTSGTLPTDYRFTGQRIDVTATNGELYDYGARFYDPVIGRFSSADSIVPEPGNPQSLNRYSYVYNNPLTYTDPTGHCPEPPPTLGSVICVAAFIPTKNSDVIPGVFGFQGDNRDFSHNSGVDDSRMWVWIDVETGQIVNPSGEAYVHETCFSSGIHCDSPRESHNDVQSQLSTDGSITLDMTFVCSTIPFCLNYVNDVNGEITFTPNDDGGYDFQASLENFPNYEAYYYEAGELSQIIFRIQNFSANEQQGASSHFTTGARMFGDDRTEYSTRYRRNNRITYYVNPNVMD